MVGEVLQAVLSALLFMSKDCDGRNGRGSSACHEV